MIKKTARSKAKQKIEYIVNSVINELRTWTKAAQHENLWEDIVDQVQIQYYIFWDAYEDILEGIINDKIEKLSKDELKYLWENSDTYNDWVEDRSPDMSEIIDGVDRLIKGIVLSRASEEERPK